MSAAIEQLDGLKKQLSIEIPADLVSSAYKKELNKVAKTIKLDGFRPGKVPMSVVEKRYGDSILAEACGKLMDQAYREALVAHKLPVAGDPEVSADPFKKDAAFTFKVVVECFPEIQLADLSKVTFEKPEATVTDADVEKVLKDLCSQQKSWNVVERASADGDQVVIDFEGFLDGEAFDGGKAEKFTLELGSKQMIPGFEEGIAGMSAGEEKMIDVTFPENYQAEHLAGKPTQFKITVHEVKEAGVPELDAELAKKFGVEGDDPVAELTKQVRDNMSSQLEQMLTNKAKEAAFDAVLAAHEFDVPAAAVDAEIEQMQKMTRERMMHEMRMQKAEVEKMDLPKDMYQEQATKRVKLGLLLAELIKHFELKAEAADIREKVDAIAKNYPNPEQVVNHYYGDQRALADIEGAVLEEKALAKLSEQAKVNVKSATFDEIMNEQRN